jgi:hypothetical protein
MAATDLLSPEEARRAVFIDFESRKDEPPALLGVVYNEGRNCNGELVLRHEIFDPALALLVEDVEITGPFRHEIVARSPHRAFSDHLGRARAQDRLLVSWSQHELEKAYELGLSTHHRQQFAVCFRDAKATARKWRSRTMPGHAFSRRKFGGTHSLSRYARLIEFPLPDDHDDSQIGTWIMTLRQALARRSNYRELTERQQKMWRDLLVKNANDCLALRAVTLRAADGLAAFR